MDKVEKFKELYINKVIATVDIDGNVLTNLHSTMA